MRKIDQAKILERRFDRIGTALQACAAMPPFCLQIAHRKWLLGRFEGRGLR